MRASSRVLVLALLALAVGCKKKDADRTATPETAAAAPTPAPAPLRVTSVDVGKHLGSDKHVSDATTTFGVRDTFNVAVLTDGAGSNATLAARLTYNGAQLVKADSQTISPSGGSAASSFTFSKATAWPKGKYRVDVLLNGTAAGSKDFEVK